MSVFLRALLRAPRAIAPVLLLAAYLIGSAAHGVHHLEDPGCMGGVDHAGHPCAQCAGLHGSTLVAASLSAPVPDPVAWVQPVFGVASAPAPRQARAAAPRAPPAS